MMRGKHKAGKWLIGKYCIRWYCRNCWAKGLTEVTSKNGAIPVIDISNIIQITCHTYCGKPDIRWYHEE